MASLNLNHIFKVYPNGVKAVNDFTIDIDDCEFIVFVGPSGCGKSTTLRMIAGLEEITAGELYIGDKLVNDLEPSERDIAMVFQNYALYPHMTVYDNMAFGLQNIHTPKDQIATRVKEAAEILGLTEYLDRKPKEMSGGQCQRVALGRAIVRNPKVFLLDEPLSNLDAKLRATMRTEISKLHQKLQTTFIYVTHDQVEAMTMGTRIVVMKDGFVQQIDTPINLYNHPMNKFVAGFIGTPQMNFFKGKMHKQNDNLVLSIEGNSDLAYSYKEHAKIDVRYLDDREIIVGVRPDHVILSDKETPLKVKVSLIEQLGNESILYGDLLTPNGTTPITMKIDPSKHFAPNDEIYIEFKHQFIHFFDAQNEVSIQRNIPESNFIDVKQGKFSLFGKDVKFPPYLASKLENGDYTIKLPLSGICEGQSFKCKVANKEVIGKEVLYTLEDNGKYYFFAAPYKEGGKELNELSFDLDFSKMDVVKDEEIVVPSVKNYFKFPITLSKGKAKKEIFKKGKTTVKWAFSLSFDLEGYPFFLPFNDVDQIINIDGKKCLKKQYDLFVSFDDLDFDGKDYSLKVEEYLDYGNQKYVSVMFGESKVILPDNSKDGIINFSYKGNNIQIYEFNSNMKLI